MNLQIDVQEKDKNAYHVTVSGEVDAYTAPELRETITPLTKNEGINIVIDLAGVSYMDSTGLGVFIGLLKSVRANNGTLTLTGMSDRVTRLFEITGLNEVMEIDPAVRGGQ
ncbi:STAS domain-containing protein [Bacillus marinisedimentorum]|uniref:STAS domain-containing protein n=1 Tax=Bacillus marinisedimentorum TaxID=1821260 RepID=UPI0008720629|nr:STAS domain-containing protein [Bacillus marinisedimentorum]